MDDGRVTERLERNARERLLLQKELGDLRRLVADLRTIGVVVEACRCGKIDCGGCPVGTTTQVNSASLSDEARKKLEDLLNARDDEAWEDLQADAARKRAMESKGDAEVVIARGRGVVLKATPEVAAELASDLRALIERRNKVWDGSDGGHDYGVVTHRKDCAFGCGAWMGSSRSGTPDGIDPFGACPKNPGRRDR